jgi:hypothetical protein
MFESYVKKLEIYEEYVPNGAKGAGANSEVDYSTALRHRGFGYLEDSP